MGDMRDVTALRRAVFYSAPCRLGRCPLEGCHPATCRQAPYRRARSYLEVFHPERSPPGRVPPGNVPPGTVPPGNVPPAGVLSRSERPATSPAFPERTLLGVLSGLTVWLTSESAGPAQQSGDINIADNPEARTSSVIRSITAKATSHERALVFERPAVSSPDPSQATVSCPGVQEK